MAHRIPGDLATLVAARVDRSGGPDACWPWTGSRDLAGYGRFGGGERFFIAHRAAFEIANGPIPEGLDVLHHCDNPPCCNPTHLFAGTDLDNVADRVRKGRTTKVRGERHHLSKLTDDQVRAIRARLGRQTQIAIGRAFGVSNSLIWQIQHGKKRAEVR